MTITTAVFLVVPIYMMSHFSWKHPAAMLSQSVWCVRSFSVMHIVDALLILFSITDVLVCNESMSPLCDFKTSNCSRKKKKDRCTSWHHETSVKVRFRCGVLQSFKCCSMNEIAWLDRDTALAAGQLADALPVSSVYFSNLRLPINVCTAWRRTR